MAFENPYPGVPMPQVPAEYSSGGGMAGLGNALLGSPLFMMGLLGLANRKNRFGGMAQGLLATNQYRQQQAKTQREADLAKLQMQVKQAQLDEVMRQQKAREALATDPRFADFAPWIQAGHGAEIAKAVLKPPKATTLQQNLEAAGLVPGTPEFQSAMMDYLTKRSGTNVTVSPELIMPSMPGQRTVFPVKADDPTKGYVVSDDKGVRVEFLPGTKVATGEEARKSAISTGIQRQLGKLQSIIDETPGVFGVSGIATARKAGNDLMAAALNAVSPITESEALANNISATVSNYVSKLISGADVPVEQQRKIEQTLPTPGQTETVYRANLKATREWIEYLENEYRKNAKLLPTIPGPPFGMAPNPPGPPGQPSLDELTDADIDAMSEEELKARIQWELEN